MWFIYSLGLLSGNVAAPCLVMVNFNYWQKPQLEVAAAVLAMIPWSQSCPSLCWRGLVAPWDSGPRLLPALPTIYYRTGTTVTVLCSTTAKVSVSHISAGLSDQSFIAVTFQVRTGPEYLADQSGIFSGLEKK